MKPSQPDVLLIRMDKIGDLVLSLNTDQAEILKNQSCFWFVSKGLGPIVRHAEPHREFQEYSKKFSFSEFKRMYRSLKILRPKTLLILHAPGWVSLCCFLAGIPQRLGRLSKWHSYLFFNKGRRQSRSQSRMHESDYNLDLLKALDTKLQINSLAPLKLSHPSASETLLKHGLTPRSYIVIHPGMMGSALNWPQSNYIQLIQHLQKKHKILITGTPADEIYLGQIRGALKDPQNVTWAIGVFSLDELIAVLQEASLVIAPSTGVLHLAAASGAPSLGLYSPRILESVVRWGPKGQRVSTLSAEGEKLISSEIMSRISIEQVLIEAEKISGLKLR